MPATPEHKAEIHALARSRINAGKPVWAETLDLTGVPRLEGDDVYDDDKFRDYRDRVVARIKTSRWYKTKGTPDADPDDGALGENLWEVVENLGDTEDVDEWFDWFDRFYDLADYARVWVKTF